MDASGSHGHQYRREHRRLPFTYLYMAIRVVGGLNGGYRLDRHPLRVMPVTLTIIAVFVPAVTATNVPQNFQPFSDCNKVPIYDSWWQPFDATVLDGYLGWTTVPALQTAVGISFQVEKLTRAALSNNVYTAFQDNTDFNHGGAYGQLHQVFHLMIWSLASAMPDKRLYRDVTKLVERINSGWLQQHRIGNPSMLAWCLSILCLHFLLELRFLSIGGRKRQQEARKFLKAMDLNFQAVIARPGTAATEVEFTVIYSLVKLQFEAFVKGTRSTTYMLEQGSNNYIGMTARPLQSRYSEHVRELRSMLKGKTLKHRRRSRYDSMLINKRRCLPHVIALWNGEQQAAAVDEATRILVAQPQCNGQELKHLSQRFRSPSARRTRQPPSARLRGRKLAHVIDDSWMGHFLEQRNHLHEKRLNAASLCFHRHVALKDATFHLQRKLQPTFRGVYFTYRNECLAIAAGPVSIYGNACNGLLLKAASQQKLHIDWLQAVEQSSASLDVAYAWWEQCCVVTPYRARVRAQSRLAAFMHEHSLPKPGQSILRVPSADLVLQARQWARRMIQVSSRSMPMLASHLRAHLRLVVTAPRSWKMKLHNMASVVRDFDWNELDHLDISQIEQQLAQVDMYRFPLTSKTSQSYDLVELRRLVNRECHRWLMPLKSPDIGLFHELKPWEARTYISPVRRRCSALAFGSVGGTVCGQQIANSQERHSQERHAQQNDMQDDFRFIADKQRLAQQLSLCKPAVALEDKDPSVLWVSETKNLMLRWRQQFRSMPTRWEFTDMSVQTAVQTYRKLLDRALPTSLQAPNSCFSGRNMPYAYPTVKRKCFGAAVWIRNGACTLYGNISRGSRTCAKQGHSCLRTIVSFFRLPSKRMYRYVGRGLEFLIQEFRPGADLPSLSEARASLKSRFECMHPRPGQHDKYCLCCGKLMKHPTLHISDAGQAFEAIKVDVIESRLDSLFDRAVMSTTCTNPSIQVHCSRKSSVSWGGFIKDDLSDRKVLLLSTIRTCVKSLLQCRLYLCGNRVLRQRCGIPIGGPISSAVLKAVLSHSEYFFDKCGWRRVSSTLEIPGQHSQYLAMGRYIDDFVCISLWFCGDCCGALVGDVYRNVICFEQEASDASVFESTVTARYLDMWLHVSWDSISFDLGVKNDVFGLTGLPSQLKKNRFLPYRSRSSSCEKTFDTRLQKYSCQAQANGINI